MTRCQRCGHDDPHDAPMASGGSGCMAIVPDWTPAGDPFPDECGCPGVNEAQGLDRSGLVHALTHTGIGNPSRVLTGTEANDVADLVFGPAGNRYGSPFADSSDATCRHQEARLPAPSYLAQESGHAPDPRSI